MDAFRSRFAVIDPETWQELRLEGDTMRPHLPIPKKTRLARRRWAQLFCRDDSGSATIETVIWLPIFALILGVIMNVSMVFFAEAQLTRIVQDGNRAFSLGRLADNEAVQNYILARISHFKGNISVTTTIADGFIQTDLEAPAGDLMPLNLVRSAFNSAKVRVSAQHIVEF